MGGDSYRSILQTKTERLSSSNGHLTPGDGTNEVQKTQEVGRLVPIPMQGGPVYCSRTSKVPEKLFGAMSDHGSSPNQDIAVWGVECLLGYFPGPRARS